MSAYRLLIRSVLSFVLLLSGAAWTASAQTKTPAWPDPPESFSKETMTLMGKVPRKRRTYTVLPGDTLESIARKLYGKPERWIDLWMVNGWLKTPNWIRPMDEIELPPTSDDPMIFGRKTAASGRLRVEEYAYEFDPTFFRSSSRAEPGVKDFTLNSMAPGDPDVAAVYTQPPPMPTQVSEMVEIVENAIDVPKKSAQARSPWAYWNSLVQSKADESVAEPPLVLGETYDLRFDLTVGAAAARVSSAADPMAQEILARLRGKRPTLIAIPIVSGGEIQLLNNGPFMFPLDPARLEGALARKDGESDLDYVRRITAATVIVPIRAIGAGCASLGLSLWTSTIDAKPALPFDFIQRRVPVGEAASCSESLPDSLHSGMSATFINRSGMAVDAALHIFEFPSGLPQDQPQAFSQAVYVDETGTARTWRLKVDLAGYIAHADVHLSRELDRALHRQIYDDLRERLTAVIFPSEEAPVQRVGAEDVKAAQAALESMKRLAKRADSRPVTIYAALVGLDGAPQVFPIGLVKGTGGEALGRRITFIEPLQKENLAESRCVSNWTFVLPTELLSESGFACPITDLDPNEALVNDWDVLKTYFKTVQGSADPEGLLLLAHQGNGILSFYSSGEPGMKADDVVRGYKAGSVGVLVSCEGSSAGAAFCDYSLLSQFNGLNMDAILVSPFMIPADVGACFARRLRLAFEEARQKSSPVTVAEIHRSVLAAMDKDAVEGVDRQRLNAAYQFVLAGNANVQICGGAK